MKYKVLLYISLVMSSAYATNYHQYSYQQADSIFYEYIELVKFNEAIPYMKAAREKSITEFGMYDTLSAHFILRLGVVSNKSVRNKEAYLLFQNSIEILDSIHRTDHIDYVDALIESAHYLTYAGELEESEQILKDILANHKTTLDKDKKIQEKFYRIFSTLYIEMEHNELAEKYQIKCTEICREIYGKNHHYYGFALKQLGHIYLSLMQYDEAEQYYIRSLKVFKNSPVKNKLYFYTLHNLAYLYVVIKDYEKAISYYQKGIEIEKDNFTSLNGLGIAYIMMNEGKKAYPLLERVIAKIEKIEITQASKCAAYFNLSLAYYKAGMYKKAIEMYNYTLFMYDQVNLKSYMYFRILASIGESYSKLNQFDKAWEYFYKGLYYFTNTELTESTQINKDWAAKILDADIQTAIQYNNTINILKMIFEHLDLQQPEKYIEKQKILGELVMQLLNRNKSASISENDKLRMLAKSQEWLFKNLKLLDLEIDVDKAYQLATFNKAVLLFEATKSSKNQQLAQLPDSLASQEKLFTEKNQKLHANLLQARTSTEKDSLRDLLNTLNLEINTFKKKITKDYPKYAQLKYTNDYVNIQQIQNQLSENEALIDYTMGDSLLYIFYIDQHQKIAKQIAIHQEFYAQIEEFRKSLTDYKYIKENWEESYQKFAKSAYHLYQKLISPISEYTNSINKLTIIPDGSLGHLPFEAFLMQKAPDEIDYSQLSYLTQQFHISYNYSSLLWLENKQKQIRSNNGQLLAMAPNYALDKEAKLLSERMPADLRTRNSIIPIPSARKEVEMIAKAFDGYFAYDAQANEHTFKEIASAYSIIHLAMHGLLNQTHPVLSSLAFTEDGDTTENNLLQAYEITKLNLNAELVVLSACETGYGKFEKGNGVASLARAFMYAGVPSLVVSLWQVNDDATGSLMHYFYKNLKEGFTKDEALVILPQISDW